MSTPCNGCPNLEPPQLPGNSIFYEIYERIQLCRHDSGALDYAVAMQLMQSMGLIGEDLIDTLDKIQAVEQIVMRDVAERRKRKMEDEKAKFNSAQANGSRQSAGKQIGRRVR